VRSHVMSIAVSVPFTNRVRRTSDPFPVTT
jgi:hypothetical protein